MKQQLLDGVAQGIKDCRACPLGELRVREDWLAVPGYGSADAKIVFVGEAPGKYEALQGRPFVGKAGSYFRQLLRNAGIDVNDVFVTNTLCCRPPQNRDPKLEELEECWEWTLEQIDIIDPDVIVAVGRFAAAQFVGAMQGGKQRIGDLHATPKWAMVAGRPRIVYPTYHPAAGQYNPDLAPIIDEGFKRLGEMINGRG